MTNLRAGIDYYLNEQGMMVLTEHYLLSRGHCCRSGCLHCPYGFRQIMDPNIPQELIDPWGEQDQNTCEQEDD